MIDILMATYNGGRYIEDQLISIFEQTVSNYHIYIRDDGSKDDTLNVISRTVERYGMEDKVTVIDDGEPSGSAKRNFTRLYSYSNSEYIMFSDQDDIWHKDKIEITLKRMKKLEAAYGDGIPFLVHTDLSIVDDELNIVSDSMKEYMNLPVKENIKSLMLQNSVSGCTMMVNQAAMKLLKRADEDGKFVMHDHFCAVVVALFGHVSYIDKATVDYRQHEANQIGASDAKSIKYKLDRLKKGREGFRHEMNNCYQQAGYVLELYSDILNVLPSDKVECVRGFASLIDKSAAERRRYFRKYGMYKRGMTKSVAQMFWC